MRFIVNKMNNDVILVPEFGNFFASHFDQEVVLWQASARAGSYISRIGM